MNNPTKIAIGLASLILFIGAAGLFTQTVEYKPYGVPDELRDSYEAKLTRIRVRQEAAAETMTGEMPVAVINKTEHNFGRVQPHTQLEHGLRSPTKAPPHFSSTFWKRVVSARSVSLVNLSFCQANPLSSR